MAIDSTISIRYIPAFYTRSIFELMVPKIDPAALIQGPINISKATELGELVRLIIMTITDMKKVIDDASVANCIPT